MLRFATRYAHWLDVWLRRRFGRPYTTILAIGIVLSISASIDSLAGVIATGAKALQGDILKTAGVVVFQIALLINQLAQLDEHRQRRRRQRMRERDKGRVAGAGAER
jgi:hypothetical protein